MYDVQDHGDVVDSDNFSQAKSCIGRPYDEKIIAAALLKDGTRALLESGSPDYWNAVEDWMLD